ncbi:MAG: nuclear transport factor 2 family protein [Chloroflexota bacterium]
MTEDEKRTILTDFAEAWGRADVDALMALMTDDCIYAASVGPEPGTTYRGREEVRRGFTEILAFEAGGEARSGQVWFADDDYAFAEWSYDEVAKDGTITDIQGIDIFHFVDGKLRLKDAYRKTRQ